ncbi:PREDICTED: endochitinase WIN8 isoform X2 [Populus euphratica]|uniref:chitinase n=1 Tax=Populus euphratica TaxID=75702 RepID=A0AAJ6Y8T7_POPEU|nr:PREDICTED: endochitinase WIN8 isoform X2 [Populus euphratica]
MRFWALSVLSLLLSLLLGVSADTAQCGLQAGNATCRDDLCCSSGGYCGLTVAYCCTGCQSQCRNCFFTEEIFEEMLPNRNSDSCPGKGFYTYEAFFEATEFYPGFGMTGDDNTRKRELAAFFAQTSQETSGRRIIGDNAPFTWGYCYVNELNPNSDYCDPKTNSTYPCVADKHYYGRGPLQLRWNHNYGECGNYLGERLLDEPEKVAKDRVLSFEAALWIWMTPHPTGAPSCHEVITGEWSPSEADIEAGRNPVVGMLTNIITNGNECTKDEKTRQQNRVDYYLRYCDMLKVDPGDNLYCDNQEPFEYNGLLKMLGTM